MATVRVTDDNIRAIKHEVSKLYSDERQAAMTALQLAKPEEHKEFKDVCRRAVYDLPTQLVLHALPGEWLPSVNFIKVINGQSTVAYLEVTPFRGTYSVYCSGRYQDKTNVVDLADPVFAEAKEVFDRLDATYQTLKAAHDEIVGQEKAAHKAVIDTFRRYPTINAALKEHPTLWAMMPKELRDRVSAVTERKKPEPKQLTLDLPAPDLSEVASRFVRRALTEDQK